MAMARAQFRPRFAPPKVWLPRRILDLHSLYHLRQNVPAILGNDWIYASVLYQWYDRPNRLIMLKRGNFPVALHGQMHHGPGNGCRLACCHLSTDGTDWCLCSPHGPAVAKQEAFPLRSSLHPEHLLLHVDLMLLLLDHDDVPDLLRRPYKRHLFCI